MATPVIMPKFEMSQETATVVAWLVAEGDEVRQGQPLLEVETDKVTMEIEAPASGVLAHINAHPGDVVPVTQVIAQILEAHEVASVQAPAQPPVRATPVAQRLAAEQRIDLAALAGSGPGGRITKTDVEAVARQSAIGDEPRPRATPAARRLAREAGIDLAGMSGSGPHNRVQADDVRAAMATKPAAGAPVLPLPAGASPALEPFVGMRATIARRMTESYQQAPHIHLTRSVDVSEAEAARRRWADKYGQHISLTVLLVKACAWALRRHLAVNATVEATGVRRASEIHVGVAVALPDGLIVPVLRHADSRSLADLAQELAALAEQARLGTLRPDQVSGGTFTLTNLGMFGVEAFDPIINPPQAAILGVGAVVDSVVPLHGQAVIRPRMQLTLAADHRALDGAVAAQFLQDICHAVEDPAAMLL